MKKFILASIAALVLTLSSYAASTSFTVTTGASTNLWQVLGTTNGGVKITSLVTSTGNSAAAVQIYDAPQTNFLVVIPAYSNILSYATNYITIYTNFYGATNSFTNIALVDYTNSVATVTQSYIQRYNYTVPTNSSLKLDGSSFFIQGVGITNSGTGSANITMFYTY